MRIARFSLFVRFFQYKLDKSAINDKIRKQISAYGRLMSSKWQKYVAMFKNIVLEL